MKEKKLEPLQQERKQAPIDLWRMMGGQAQRVRSSGGKSVDSMLAVYQDRCTYTFIMQGEVSSIHFDRRKQEIFIKGHNIKNMKLSQEHKMALEGLKEVLAREERGQPLSADYEATLGKLLADK